jgi:hypothetical protein
MPDSAVDIDALVQKHQELLAVADKELAAAAGPPGADIDMIELQRLINKRNEAYHRLSETIRKQQEALNNIVNNMR